MYYSVKMILCQAISIRTGVLGCVNLAFIKKKIILVFHQIISAMIHTHTHTHMP